MYEPQSLKFTKTSKMQSSILPMSMVYKIKQNVF